MTRQTFPPRPDAASNDDEPAPPPRSADGLGCAAHGCPNRWTVATDRGWHLCSPHARAPHNLWPIVSEEQRRSAHDMVDARSALPPRADPALAQAARERLAALREELAANDSAPPARRWAWRLRALELAGGQLSEVRRAAWRAALGYPIESRADWTPENPT